jgi:hypothetical protein
MDETFAHGVISRPIWTL